MSAETKEAIEAAIQAHIADECDGALASSWVAIAEYVDVENADDGMTHVQDIVADGQSNMTTVGLTYFVTQMRTKAE